MPHLYQLYICVINLNYNLLTWSLSLSQSLLYILGFLWNQYHYNIYTQNIYVEEYYGHQVVPTQPRILDFNSQPNFSLFPFTRCVRNVFPFFRALLLLLPLFYYWHLTRVWPSDYERVKWAILVHLMFVSEIIIILILGL